MDEDIVLKIKEKEALEVLKYIFIIYGIFLFVLGAILEYEETIIQVTFIIVFSIIVDMLNFGEFTVSTKGIKSKDIKFIRYKDIYRTEFKDRTLTIYTRTSKKPYRINFAKNEDYTEIEKAYKYIDAKVKKVEEDIKEHEDFVEKISK